MPTYDYECEKCGHVFEVFHSMSQTPEIKCEECGGATRKLIGAGAGIIFKGSGFYETDYKRKSGVSSVGSNNKAPKSESKDSKSGSESTKSKNTTEAKKKSE